MAGHFGYPFLRSLTGNSLMDSVMMFSAEYAIFVLPVSLVYLWFRSDEAKGDSLFGFYTVVAGLGMSYFLGLFYFHKPPHLQGFETILQNSPANAFPSQHAAAAFSLVWPLIYRSRTRLAGIVLSAAVLTGLARAYTGLHFPIDILGGVVSSFLGFGFTYLAEDYLESVSRILVDSWNRLVSLTGL